MNRRAFTLVELVVGIGVMSVLTAGITSAVLLAGKGMPDAGGRSAATADARRLTQRLADDIELATEITELGPDRVAFTVADRNSDGLPESYRYELDSATRSKLVRTTNGGTPVVIAENVKEFSLAATSGTVSAESTVNLVTDEERLLYVYKGGGSSKKGLTLLFANAMWIKPLLPADATAYVPTRARVFITPNGAKLGILSVELKADAGGKPAALTFDQGTILESSLANGGTWASVNFPLSRTLLPGSAFFIVLRSIDITVAAEIETSSNPVPQTVASLYTSDDGGVTWVQTPDRALPIEVYGRVIRQRATKVVQTSLEALEIRLRVGAGEAALAAPRPLARPVILGAPPPPIEAPPVSEG